MYIKPVNVNTRGNTKKKFKLPSKCTSKYINSPLYRGSVLWDNLEKCVQDIPSQQLFNRKITKMYKEYVDLLVQK